MPIYCNKAFFPAWQCHYGRVRLQDLRQQLIKIKYIIILGTNSNISKHVIKKQPTPLNHMLVSSKQQRLLNNSPWLSAQFLIRCQLYCRKIPTNLWTQTITRTNVTICKYMRHVIFLPGVVGLALGWGDMLCESALGDGTGNCDRSSVTVRLAFAACSAAIIFARSSYLSFTSFGNAFH